MTFFPHLIAGPIVRYRDLVPQFSRKPDSKYYNLTDLAVGLTIFFIGLFKKVILADTVAVHVNMAFTAAAAGAPATLLEAWGASLAFLFQLYFDFSGYSDMAIGLGRIFGIRLPVNFNSPLKAVNFIDFWQRWHITLSLFIRDYLFFPLVRSLRGPGFQYLNIMIVMLLVGLWHGAGWTFILWGGLHGLYLIINHLWRGLRRSWGHNFSNPSRSGIVLSMTLTFIFLVASAPLFRADTFKTALGMYKGMMGLNGILLPQGHVKLYGLEFLIPTLTGWHIQVGNITLLGPYVMEWLILCWFIVWFMPNTQEIMSRVEPALGYKLKETEGTWAWLRWNPTPVWALVCGVMAVASLLMVARPSPFIYFQF